MPVFSIKLQIYVSWDMMYGALGFSIRIGISSYPSKSPYLSINFTAVMFVTGISHYIEYSVLSAVSHNHSRSWNVLPMSTGIHLHRKFQSKEGRMTDSPILTLSTYCKSIS
jgi:hypothetical protein